VAVIWSKKSWGMITGKTLIDLGFKPSKWFKEAIEYANQHNLQGADLINYVNSIRPKVIEPYEKPLAYFKNIRAESEDEVSNVRQVLETMEELMKTPTITKGAIMPDACPTGARGQIPVGGIVANKKRHTPCHA
jgi:tRNA-splicing ligase RtcB